ncbi:MAG: alpha-L-fucosidase [Akkermansiaceae bacterium]
MTKNLLLATTIPALALIACDQKKSSQTGHTDDCCPPPSEIKVPPAANSSTAPTAPTAAEIEQTAIPQLTETPEQLEERLQWFRDAKFGLFIHWGPAAISGQEISWGMKDRIEGGEKHKVVPRETYMNLYKDFNPTAFNADELVSLAKEAGMKYFVFVTKHHDGFSMWPTKEKRFAEGDGYPAHFSIADTPYQGDPVRMMQEAGKKHGLKIGWYYSTRDWTHPNYLQGDGQIYNDYYENQVEELLSEYGPVDVLWFDHCFGKWDQYTIPRLYRKMYAYNPQLIVNNRAARGLPDIPGEFKKLASADYDTPENRMGAFQHGRAWESCMILSPHPDHGGWSYRPDAQTRSLTETIQLLSSCVTGDGNMLLNLAPLPDGTLKPEEKAILEGIAPWIGKYGEAVYSTRGGPWINGSWGGATYRDKHVYLHIFNPGDDALLLNRLPQNVTAATTIDGQAIPFSQDDKTVSITLPADARDPHVSIIKLTLDAPVSGVQFGPALANESENEVPGTMTFTVGDATLSTGMQIVGEGDNKAVRWENAADSLSWPLEIDSPGEYTVEVTASCASPGSILTAHFGKNIKGIHGPVPVTGDHGNYQSFTLRKVYFPNAESTRISLRAGHPQAWQAVQLKKIKLIPSN